MLSLYTAMQLPIFNPRHIISIYPTSTIMTVFKISNPIKDTANPATKASKANANPNNTSSLVLIFLICLHLLSIVRGQVEKLFPVFWVLILCLFFQRFFFVLMLPSICLLFLLLYDLLNNKPPIIINAMLPNLDVIISGNTLFMTLPVVIEMLIAITDINVMTIKDLMGIIIFLIPYAMPTPSVSIFKLKANIIIDNISIKKSLLKICESLIASYYGRNQYYVINQRQLMMMNFLQIYEIGFKSYQLLPIFISIQGTSNLLHFHDMPY